MRTMTAVGLAALLGAAGAEAKSNKGKGHGQQGEQGGGQCKNLLAKASGARVVVEDGPQGSTLRLMATDPSQVVQVQRLAHQIESCLNGQKPRGGDEDRDHDRDDDDKRKKKDHDKDDD